MSMDRLKIRGLAAVLFVAVLSAGLVVASREARAETLQTLDAAARELAAFILRCLPDRSGRSLGLSPFLTADGEPVLLGDRLSAELELALARRYRRTRVGAQGSGRVYTVSGELAVHSQRLRILCRLLAPDGSLVCGTSLDLELDSELAEFLVPAAAQSDYQGMGLPEAGPAFDLDPLEPDNMPGAEVEVRSSSMRFERYLSSADVDRFRFHLAQTGPAVIEVQAALEVQLLLYREGERIPFQVRGNPSLRSIRLETRLQPGYYIAELLAFDPDIEGRYSIAFQLGPAPAFDPFEPDEGPEQARPLEPGARLLRALTPADQDWFQLAAGRPGFYVLYTTGSSADTLLELYRDGRVLLASDDDGGAQNNACLGFFLGTGRLLARLTGKPPLDSGPYTLTFENLQPALIVPASLVRELAAADKPLFLQLRIVQAGKYLIRARAARGPIQAELYDLPAMKARAIGGSIFLEVGDYLLVLKADEGETIRFCAAGEAEAQTCRTSLGE